MKLSVIREIINGEILWADGNLQAEFERIFACDLMSDVLALVDEDVILATGLVNIQTIRTAEMKDLKCVIFVRGKKPSREVLALAEAKGIMLLTTKYTMFEACGRLYAAGMKGITVDE